MALHGAQVTAMTQGKAGGFWILSSSRSLEMQAESAEAAAEWIKLLQDTANRVDLSPQVPGPGAGSRRGSQEPSSAATPLCSDTLEEVKSKELPPQLSGALGAAATPTVTPLYPLNYKEVKEVESKESSGAEAAAAAAVEDVQAVAEEEEGRQVEGGEAEGGEGQAEGGEGGDGQGGGEEAGDGQGVDGEGGLTPLEAKGGALKTVRL